VYTVLAQVTRSRTGCRPTGFYRFCTGFLQILYRVFTDFVQGFYIFCTGFLQISVQGFTDSAQGFTDFVQGFTDFAQGVTGFPQGSTSSCFTEGSASASTSNTGRNG
jgi:hypothetical protein